MIWMYVWCCALLGMAQNNDEKVGLRLFGEKSYSEALPYLQRAAKAGSLPALDCLGQMYGDGLGVEKNETIMFNMYHKAVQGNYAPSMVNLGFHYLFDKDEEALKWWEKAAQLKSAQACRLLGNYYEKGFGGEVDLEKGLSYYSRAMEYGEWVAYNDLGRTYVKLGDSKKAYEMYMKAYEHSVLAEDCLESLMGMLCDKTTLYYSTDYDENVMKAAEVLKSVQASSEKKEELRQKYGETLIAASLRVKYAQQKKAQYHALVESCFLPVVQYAGTDHTDSGAKVDFVSIPAYRKTVVGKGGLFGDNFTISFFMKTTDLGNAQRLFFYGFNNYPGANADKPDFPIVSVENGLLVLKNGKESYQTHPFKQFRNAKQALCDGKWHYVVLTCSAANKKAEIYVDGRWKANEYLPQGKSLQHACLVFCAGGRELKIGNLRFFKNKALNGDEIGILYSNDYK